MKSLSKTGLALTLAAMLGWPLPALAAPLGRDCEFTAGFATIVSDIPDVVGGCLENEHAVIWPGNVPGSVQDTENGVLIWEMGSWPAFVPFAGSDVYRLTPPNAIIPVVHVESHVTASPTLPAAI